MNAAFENPQRIPLLIGGSLWGFICFGMCSHKLPFSVCGYRFQNGWDFKGIADSFDSGFPIGAKASCWHTILLAKSSVLYLLRPWAAQRDCSMGNKHFELPTEQADFGSLWDGKFVDSLTRNPAVRV